MTNHSLPHDPTAILTAVESFIDTLPPKKRRRTGAEIEADSAPETENYAPEADPPIIIELDAVAQAALPILLFKLGRARNDAESAPIAARIYELLDLELK